MLYNNQSGTSVGASKLLRSNSVIPSLYSIVGAGGANNAVVFQIFSDSLKVQNYLLPPLNFIGFDGLNYPGFTVEGQLFIPDFDKPNFSLRITRNSNGSLDGSFIGKVYNTDAVTDRVIDSLSITDGEFKNVRIVY